MKRSKHSLSHYRLTSMNMGQLYPVALQEVLPGDSFRHATSALVRVSPLVAPVMHPCHLMVHSWFVPSRLLWSKWEDFITGKDPALVIPTLSVAAADTATKKLANAFGVGIDSPPAPVSLNALPFRAYNQIWNEFYRDQDLSTAAVERTGDSGDVPADYQILNVSWEKDYFTTSRPNSQQGTGVEQVQLTLTGKVPVKGIGKGTGVFGTVNKVVRESDGSTPTYAKSAIIGPSNVDEQFWIQENPGALTFPQVHVDLSQTSAGGLKMDINEWRKTMAMQRMREHRNRFGSRYRDMLAFLGVNSSDARLQRPEYLGGGKQTISFSEVLSTAETTTAAVGEMAGHGIAALRSRPYKKFFEEHGYVLTFISCRPVSVYQQAVPRTFLRRDYEHYWQKELEMMGDQQITNFEVYGDSATPNTVFGYIPRYDEYRHAESFVSGEFRSTLNYWHMARIFGSQPVLNQSFVGCDPTTRIYASAVTDQLYVMCSHRIAARRLVSKQARN